MYLVEGPEHGFTNIPTGIFSMEVIMASKSTTLQDISCGSCQSGGHEWDARFRRNCGSPLGTFPEDRTESEV